VLSPCCLVELAFLHQFGHCCVACNSNAASLLRLRWRAICHLPASCKALTNAPFVMLLLLLLLLLLPRCAHTAALACEAQQSHS
jgi:hypothetical protein